MSIFNQIVTRIRNLFGVDLTYTEMAAKLDALAAAAPEKLDWRQSIVDLLKLVKLDSSLSNRKALAKEFGYTGKLDGSAAMNIFVHGHVMQRLSEHGGSPDSLKG